MKSYRQIIKEQDDYDSRLYKDRLVKCSCSHTVTFGLNDRKICNCCGNWVYRTPEAEFRYKMLEAIKDKGKEEKNNECNYDTKREN